MYLQYLTHDNCTKRFWLFIKGKRKEHISINTLQPEGKSYTQSTAKASTLNKQFASYQTSSLLLYILKKTDNQFLVYKESLSHYVSPFAVSIIYSNDILNQEFII